MNRFAATRLVLLTWALGAVACDSILGIEVQTFDGGAGVDSGNGADAAGGDSGQDSTVAEAGPDGMSSNDGAGDASSADSTTDAMADTTNDAVPDVTEGGGSVDASSDGNQDATSDAAAESGAEGGTCTLGTDANCGGHVEARAEARRCSSCRVGKTVKAHAAQQLQLAGNGPSLDLADELHVMSKKMTLQSSGARISLGDSAVVQSSSVQLGKPNQATLPPDTPTPAPTPPLSITLLHTDHTPLANCHFQLELGGTTLEGTTNGAGGITVSSPPPELKNGRCTVWTGDFPIGPRLVLDITFDTIEPAADITGAQKRLRNLGYLRAAPTGIFDTPTMDAVLIFQQTHDLELTGELDGPTTAKLSEIHP